MDIGIKSIIHPSRLWLDEIFRWYNLDQKTICEQPLALGEANTDLLSHLISKLLTTCDSNANQCKLLQLLISASFSKCKWFFLLLYVYWSSIHV